MAGQDGTGKKPPHAVPPWVAKALYRRAWGKFSVPSRCMRERLGMVLNQGFYATPIAILPLFISNPTRQPSITHPIILLLFGQTMCSFGKISNARGGCE